MRNKEIYVFSWGALIVIIAAALSLQFDPFTDFQLASEAENWELN